MHFQYNHVVTYHDKAKSLNRRKEEGDPYSMIFFLWKEKIVFSIQYKGNLSIYLCTSKYS